MLHQFRQSGFHASAMLKGAMAAAKIRAMATLDKTPTETQVVGTSDARGHLTAVP